MDEYMIRSTNKKKDDGTSMMRTNTIERKHRKRTQALILINSKVTRIKLKKIIIVR